MKHHLLFLLAVMTLTTLACAVPAAVMTPTVGHDTPKPVVMTTPVMTAVVTASLSLNVRQSPGEHERVIGALYNGDPVVMTGKCSDGWAQIEWQGGKAWVNAGYLSENKCKE